MLAWTCLRASLTAEWSRDKHVHGTYLCSDIGSREARLVLMNNGRSIDVVTSIMLLQGYPVMVIRQHVDVSVPWCIARLHRSGCGAGTLLIQLLHSSILVIDEA